MTAILVIRSATADDACAMLAIYEPFVLDTTVSFETAVPSIEEFQRRIERSRAHSAWLTAVAGETIAGYAYATPHRERQAYRFTVEVSLYVHPEFQRCGVGRQLYLALFERLAEQGYGTALAGIALPNPASIAFHTSLGFSPAGVFRHAGYKLGAWRDIAWWQRALRSEPETGLAPPRDPPGRS